MKTNKYVINTILVGKFQPLLLTIKGKLSYYGHTCRHNSMAKKDITMKDGGFRIRDRPKKDWMSNIIM